MEGEIQNTSVYVKYVEGFTRKNRHDKVASRKKMRRLLGVTDSSSLKDVVRVLWC